MTKFNYYIDRKHTIWARDKYEIEAESQEQADEIMKKELIGENANYYVESYDFEYLYETSELMWTEEIKGFPTSELYNNKGELLLTNKTK